MKRLFLFFLFMPFLLFSQDLNADLLKNVKAGNYDKVVELLSSGADVNYIGEFKWTPLMWAVRNNYKKIVECLLSKGAVLDLEGSAKDVVLIARENGFDELSSLLLSADTIYNNLEDETDKITKEKFIRSPVLNAEDQRGISYFRIFAKVEDGDVFFAISLKYLNKQEEDIGGIAYSEGKSFETFSKKMAKTLYKKEYYFVEHFTILMDTKDFLDLIKKDKDVPFGIRRAKYDFDFVVPIGVLKAVYKKADKLGFLPKSKNEVSTKATVVANEENEISKNNLDIQKDKKDEEAKTLESENS